MIKEMYSATANSPSTTLDKSIDAIQTTITVTDVTLLPTAPNLITIGYNQDNPETVLMISRNGNSIIVMRGYEGVARAWAKGMFVSRVFTAYDHNTFIENINEIKNNLGSSNIKSVNNQIPDTDGNITLTKANISLDEVDNTSDVNKPISTITQSALDNKVGKVLGKDLSTNDFTNEEKNNVDNLKVVAITGSYNDLLDKPTIPDVQTYSVVTTSVNGLMLSTDKIVLDGLANTVSGIETLLAEI